MTNFENMTSEVEESANESINEEHDGEYVTLKNHPLYEILNVYPFTIKRKRDGYVVSESNDKDGYIQVNLNRKPYKKHRLIALQFIPNPDNLEQVDHINHNRSDNHIENLRWCSQSTNQRNRTSHKGNTVYEFITDLPEESIKIDYYDTRTERHEFADNQYFYARVDGEDRFYTRITDDGLYKIMHINTLKNGNQHVKMMDINNKQISVYISKLKHIFDIHV